MGERESFGSFFRENKAILKEYIETRLEIYRLQSVRIFSKSAGYLTWIIISLFLLFLIILFAGLVLGFWLSTLTGSFVEGFGITTLFLIVIFSLLMIFRKKLFINPIIQSVIEHSDDELDDDDDETNK